MALASRKQLVVTTPRVFVVGYQQIHYPGLSEFLRSEGYETWGTAARMPGEVLPEVAGRLCYMSFNAGRPHDEYVGNIKRDRHGSVLEHAIISVILTGVSRSFTHELVRHRAGWSYSQLSQRFVDEGQAQYVVPWAIAQDEALCNAWTRMIEAVHGMYVSMRDQLRARFDPGDGEDRPIKLLTRLRKIINGAARSLLPNATETKIYCTVNARALRHFLEMRASEHADHEIRSVAMLLYRAVLPFLPDILGDYTVEFDDDGVEYLATTFIKV